MEKTNVIGAKDLAVQKAGGVTALARLCGVARQSVQKWDRVPIEHVKLVSRELKIPLADLLPDETRGA